MKPIQPLFLILTLLFLFTARTSAQKKQLGIDAGFGKTQTYFYSGYTYPYNGDKSYLEDYLKVGLSYQYTPKKIFSIMTGLYYEERGKADEKKGYIKVPAGVDFSIGRLFQFVVGVGLYSGILISNKYYPLSKVNLGCYWNLGIVVPLSPRVNMNVSYQQDFDISANEYQRRSPGGNSYSELYRGFDRFFGFSLKFDLIKK